MTIKMESNNLGLINYFLGQARDAGAPWGKHGWKLPQLTHQV